MESKKPQRNSTRDDPKPGRRQPPRKRRKTIKRKTAERSPGHSDSTISFDGDEDDNYLYKFGEGPGRSHAPTHPYHGRGTEASNALACQILEEGIEFADANFLRDSGVNTDVSDQSSPSPVKRAAPMGQIRYRKNDVEGGHCKLFHAENFDRDHHQLASRHERADSQETIALPEEYFQFSQAEKNFPEDPHDPHSAENLAREFDYSVQAAKNRSNLRAILNSRAQPKYHLTEELASKNSAKFSQEDWDQHVKEHERY